MEDMKTFFYSKIKKLGIGCWEWDGQKTTQNYGMFVHNKIKRMAHRASWNIHIGKIPVGMCILHKCDNPPCVNPSHLFIGDMSDNMRDKSNKGRHHNQKKTHCPKGHEYNLDNTYYGLRKSKDGAIIKSKTCKACTIHKAKLYKERIKMAKKSKPNTKKPKPVKKGY